MSCGPRFGQDVVREEDHGVEGGVVLRQRLLAYRPELAESFAQSAVPNSPFRYPALPAAAPRRGGIALRRKRCGGGMESGSESRRVPRMPKCGACEPLRSPAPNTICIASDAASSAATYFNACLTKFR